MKNNDESRVLMNVDFSVCLAEDGDYRLSNIEKLAEDLLPASASKANHRIIAARELFVGIVAYLFDSDGPPVTMQYVYRELSIERETSEHFRNIVRTRREKLSPNAYLFLTKFCNSPKRQRDAVREIVWVAICCPE